MPGKEPVYLVRWEFLRKVIIWGYLAKILKKILQILYDCIYLKIEGMHATLPQPYHWQSTRCSPLWACSGGCRLCLALRHHQGWCCAEILIDNQKMIKHMLNDSRIKQKMIWYLEKALSQGIIKIEEIYYLYLLPTSGSPTYLYPALVTKLTSLPGTRSLSAGCRWRSSRNMSSVSSVQWLLCGE